MDELASLKQPYYNIKTSIKPAEMGIEGIRFINNY
jgi:hypothetical protein